jgi:hypothetical protein
VKDRNYYKGLFIGVVMFPLVCVLLATCSGCAQVPVRSAPAPAFNPHGAAVSLEFTDGLCGGTIYLNHTVLTAAHCMAGGPLVAINALPAKSLWTLKDKTDHTFVVTNQTFQMPAYPTVRFTNGLPQGTNFTFYGNPLGIRDQFRQGYVTGTCPASYCFPGLDVELNLPKDYPVTLLSVMGQHGDSGSGIYNGAGELVGVVSLVQEQMPAPFVPMGALPFTFTRGDIALVELMNDGTADAMAPAP